MAGGTGSTVALAVRRADRRVVGHFCALHALSAGDAVDYVPASATDRQRFELLKAHGIVRPAAAGRYWIDLPAYKAMADARRAGLVPVVIATCVVLAAAVLALYRG